MRNFLQSAVTKNRLRAITLLLLFLLFSSFFIFHMASMWQKGLADARDGSTSLSVFVDASDWLSKNLGPDEIALVPMHNIFDVLNPQLRGKLIDYKSIWDLKGIIIQANTTKEEASDVRRCLVDFLKEKPQVRYVVRDWVDPYAKHLFEATVNDELFVLLHEVEVFPFTLSTGWSNQITVYERVDYVGLFSVDFGVPLKQFAVLPSDVLVEYGSEGATIDKAVSRVGFYLPLEEGGINVSRWNYLKLQFKPDVEDLQLLLVFYSDANRDVKWSGYDIDYVKSGSFNLTRLGWTAGEWHTIYQAIPKAEDPLVQIGIIMTGDKNGTVTLKNLEVYTETPFET